jgi:hypothetical protein
MRPITVTAGPLAAADADGIAQAQNPASTFTLNGALVSGGVALLGAPRRVLITTTGNETGVTFTVTGTNLAGDVLTEALAGVNNTTTYTALDFYTVTSVTNSAALTGNVTIGTNGVGGSPWVRIDDYGASYISVQARVSGTVNYTLQQTLEDPNGPVSPVSPANVLWQNINDSGAVAATTSVETNYMFAPTWCRVLLNSQTNPGYVTVTYLQSGTP